MIFGHFFSHQPKVHTVISKNPQLSSQTMAFHEQTAGKLLYMLCCFRFSDFSYLYMSCSICHCSKSHYHPTIIFLKKPSYTFHCYLIIYLLCGAFNTTFILYLKYFFTFLLFTDCEFFEGESICPLPPPSV